MADPSRLASDLRLGVERLTGLAAADLRLLFGEVSAPGAARDALMDVLPALVDTYGTAAATLAADWYDDTREAAGIGGSFRAEPAEIGDTGTSGLARWGLAPAFAAGAADWRRAEVLVLGGLQKRIANASRLTVMGSTVRDPRSAGWQRVGDGESCPFCLMLIARGAVYRERTATFASHEFCGCQAVPAFRGEPVPVKPFRPTSRNVTDADRARVRDWIAQNL